MLQKEALKGKNNVNKVNFINKNTKLTSLEKHVCQNNIDMATSKSRHKNLSYQIISR